MERDLNDVHVQYRLLRAIHDLSAGMPTVDVPEQAAARKARLDPDSPEATMAMAHLMDLGYVRGTNIMGQKVYRITASGIEEATKPTQ